MFVKFTITLTAFLSTLVLNSSQQTVLKCVLKSRQTRHPLKVEVYPMPSSMVCKVADTRTDSPSIDRIIYYNDAIDIELCAKYEGRELGADIFVSDPNKVAPIASISLGNQTTRHNKLFIPEGSLLLDDVIDSLTIDLNDFQLKIVNISFDTNIYERKHNIISFGDFDVINNDDNNHEMRDNESKSGDKESETTDSTIGGYDFDTVMGAAMGVITFVILYKDNKLGEKCEDKETVQKLLDRKNILGKVLPEDEEGLKKYCKDEVSVVDAKKGYDPKTIQSGLDFAKDLKTKTRVCLLKVFKPSETGQVFAGICSKDIKDPLSITKAFNAKAKEFNDIYKTVTNYMAFVVEKQSDITLATILW
ncbi:unnamed protein product [Oppiella nova]|uniref:Uncharacterized protein n=1 Tax=Oppiella nova TaxID=334625 RepID=A0A7R9QDG4_9ACAR|nr:unnamed protein product [Oppiella nova]CAG2163661.1 unnamed protein product [Oppiella nova]